MPLAAAAHVAGVAGRFRFGFGRTVEARWVKGADNFVAAGTPPRQRGRVQSFARASREPAKTKAKPKSNLSLQRDVYDSGGES